MPNDSGNLSFFLHRTTRVTLKIKIKTLKFLCFSWIKKKNSSTIALCRHVKEKSINKKNLRTIKRRKIVDISVNFLVTRSTVSRRIVYVILLFTVRHIMLHGSNNGLFFLWESPKIFERNLIYFLSIFWFKFKMNSFSDSINWIFIERDINSGSMHAINTLYRVHSLCLIKH